MAYYYKVTHKSQPGAMRIGSHSLKFIVEGNMIQRWHWKGIEKITASAEKQDGTVTKKLRVTLCGADSRPFYFVFDNRDEMTMAKTTMKSRLAASKQVVAKASAKAADLASSGRNSSGSTASTVASGERSLHLSFHDSYQGSFQGSAHSPRQGKHDACHRIVGGHSSYTMEDDTTVDELRARIAKLEHALSVVVPAVSLLSTRANQNIARTQSPIRSQPLPAKSPTRSRQPVRYLSTIRSGLGGHRFHVSDSNLAA